MKENENKKTVVRLTEGNPNGTTDLLLDSTKTSFDKFRKPLIFGLMGIVFVGCMYLIFKPSEDKNKIENIGLNDAVPQATGEGMQADKQKAYEQEMLEQKDAEKRNDLTTLSDYWNTDDSEEPTNDPNDKQENNVGKSSSGYGNPTVNSCRNAQASLGSFYKDDTSETMELRKQLDELKEQLAEKDIPKATTLDDQVALMEKSYQMAAKYLPTGANTSETGAAKVTTMTSKTSTQKENFVAFTPTRKNTVSALYREPSDSTFLADWSETRNRGFYTAGSEHKVIQPKNSIKACVQQTQTVIGETGIRLRLLEPAQTSNRTIPKGTILTANAKFQSGRLQLKVTSIELEGNIIPVDITIYDLDGQQGLYVPNSPERNAVTDIVANMGNATGSSFSMNSSTGQQIGSDLSKTAVQGISGYFAKKTRTPKITLKGGYQVFLVSKK